MGSWWGYDVMQMFNELFPNSPKIGAVALAAWAIWFILSTVLHELGHGWVAIKCGDDTPEQTGHMTLDPITHMGLVSLVLFAVTGLGWGMMPVNPANFRRKHDDALVSAAGPAVDLILAVVCVIGAIVSHFVFSPEALPYALTIFRIGSVMNVTLATMNLLPLPPLDGSRMLASFVRPMQGIAYSPQGAMIGLVTFLILGRLLGMYFIVFAVIVCIGAENFVLVLTGHS